MGIFLLGDHLHQRKIYRIPYLIDLSASFSISKLKHYTFIYIHSEAWFARDIMILTLAMIHILAIILTLAMHDSHFSHRQHQLSYLCFEILKITVVQEFSVTK